MGFFTKYGDGGCDLTPLAGLTKRPRPGDRLAAGRVRRGHREVTGKVPTADLETGKPGVPDEIVLGVTYDEIDDFLEGKEIDEKAADTIIGFHRRTIHERTVPIAP